MPVEFTCEHCNRSIRVRDELAGKRVKCPGCAEAVSVPEEDEPAPAKRAAAKAEKPSPAPRRGRDDDDDDDDRPRKRSSRDDDDEEDRPRRRSSRDDDDEAPRRSSAVRDTKPSSRYKDDEEDEKPSRSRRGRDDEDDDDERFKKPAKKKAGGSWLPLTLGIGGGVLGLVLVGLLIWWLFSGGGGGALTPWVPGDAQTFVSIRVADLLNNAKAKETIDKLKQKGMAPNDFLEKAEKETGFKPTDVERVTVVHNTPREEWVIIETLTAVDEAGLRGKFQDVKESTHEGKKYYTGKKGFGTVCMHFASSRMVIQANNEDSMKKALATSANRKSGPLDTALGYLSSSRHIVMGFRKTDEMKAPPGMPPEYQVLTEFQSGAFTMSVSQKIDMQVVVNYADGTKADSAKKAAEKGIDALKKLIDAMSVLGGAQGAQLGEAKKYLDNVKFSQSGSQVTASLSVDFNPADLDKLPGPMGPGPGIPKKDMGGPGPRPKRDQQKDRGKKR